MQADVTFFTVADDSEKIVKRFRYNQIGSSVDTILPGLAPTEQLRADVDTTDVTFNKWRDAVCERLCNCNFEMIVYKF